MQERKGEAQRVTESSNTSHHDVVGNVGGRVLLGFDEIFFVFYDVAISALAAAIFCLQQATAADKNGASSSCPCVSAPTSERVGRDGGAEWETLKMGEVQEVEWWWCVMVG